MQSNSRIFLDLINAGYDPIDLGQMESKELHALHAKEFPAAPIIILTATANGGVSRKVAA